MPSFDKFVFKPYDIFRIEGETGMYNPQLETFICVADEGSFNKASEKLFISSTAVIKQINSLEHHLGIQLFIRTHRGLYLTEAGKSLYEDAKYIIEYSKRSIQKANGLERKDDHIIHIGISPLTPTSFLSEIVKDEQNKYTNYKFQMIPFENNLENAQEILANLGENIDVIAGIFDEGILSLRQCNGIMFSKKRLCIAMSTQHSLAKKSMLSIKDIQHETLMMIHEGWSRTMDNLRRDLKKECPNIKIKDFDFYNLDVFNQCENNQNIIIAVEGWDEVHPFMKFVPVDWDYEIPFGFLYSKSPTKKIQDLIHTIRP